MVCTSMDYTCKLDNHMTLGLLPALIPQRARRQRLRERAEKYVFEPEDCMF